jgi:crossover junction endodeoxyribonuclease RusA
MISLTFPEPPSSNRYWRNVNGRMVLSKAAKDYRATVALACLRSRLGAPLAGDVAVTLKWFRSRKSGDLDNRIKQALDALQGVVVANDSLVCELHCYRADDKTNPRLEVSIATIPETSMLDTANDTIAVRAAVQRVGVLPLPDTFDVTNLLEDEHDPI